MTTIQCPVCSREVEFKVKYEAIDIPGVLKEYIQCPKCPYTRNINLTTKEIIDLENQIKVLDVTIAAYYKKNIEINSITSEVNHTLKQELVIAKRELANKLNEQS